jgi:hypothetical protein
MECITATEGHYPTLLTTAIISTRWAKASLETVLDYDIAHENWEKIHHVLQQVGVIQDAQFLAVCSASTLAETLSISSLLRRQSREKRGAL